VKGGFRQKYREKCEQKNKISNICRGDSTALVWHNRNRILVHGCSSIGPPGIHRAGLCAFYRVAVSGDMDSNTLLAFRAKTEEIKKESVPASQTGHRVRVPFVSHKQGM
jgi:hypothetical protein